MKIDKEDYAPALSLVVLVVAIMCAILTGCTAAPERVICPPLVQYAPQEQAALANELRAHPDLKEVPVFLKDYGNERAECAALGEKKEAYNTITR